METEGSKPLDPIDKEWYPEIEKLGSFEAFTYLGGDRKYREEQKDKFLNKEIENPTLDYPKLNIEELSKRDQNLREYKKRLITNEEDETLRQIYRWKTNEKIAENAMLMAAANGDIKRFSRYSEFVYGKPSEEVFAYTINTVRRDAERALENENPQIQESAQKVLNTLPNNLPNPEISLPSNEAVEYAIEQTHKEIGSLISLPEEENIDAEGIKEAFKKALTTLGAENNWNVFIDENGTAINVNQDERIVNIPSTRNLTQKQLEKLAAHEIGTHVQRREKGQRSKLMLLGIGLDRYEKGEEGIATMREQAVDENVNEFTRADAHLAISFAKGLDGTPRDFRETFKVIKEVMHLEELQKGLEADEAEDEARERAWNRCVRTFRGTDCKTKGAVFTKDIAYREGNIGIWHVIKDNPDEMVRFSVGKYNPMNERHIQILETLGITNEDLDHLEKDDDSPQT